MDLRQLLKTMPAVAVEGPLDREVVGLTYDSRRVTPGVVFFAVPGLNTDGHEFIPVAIERGASAVICERNGFVSRRATRVKVADCRAAMARAAATFYGHPSSQLQVVGITGTNGKTCVAFILKAILNAANQRTGLISTICHELGDRVIPAQRTTPEAVEVQQMLAAMVRADCRACVLEVSSHALVQQRVAGIELDAAVFTNLSADHLDYHESFEDYFAAKKLLFHALEQGTKRGGAIINIDDLAGARLTRETNAEVTLTYGFGEPARVRASRLQMNATGTRMRLETPAGNFDCRVSLLGRYNVYNVLAAVGAALVLRVPLPTIRQALMHLAPVPGRLERVACGQPFAVFVDYAHTESALRQVLTALREFTSGRLLLVLGCGGSRDTAKRPRMGRVAAELADLTYITTDNPRREEPAAIAGQIEAGYRELRAEGCVVELERHRAIEAALREAQTADTVLIAGKGHETYQEIADTIIPFDDRIHASEVLASLGYRRGARNQRWG